MPESGQVENTTVPRLVGIFSGVIAEETRLRTALGTSHYDPISKFQRPRMQDTWPTRERRCGRIVVDCHDVFTKWGVPENDMGIGSHIFHHPILPSYETIFASAASESRSEMDLRTAIDALLRQAFDSRHRKYGGKSSQVVYRTEQELCLPAVPPGA
ncbi:hypothetical protein Agabi119p4_9657 [Agaricus bisporus var. burnettii]|uniref:Uncharacterized protein n=1 Tax=Agaricus bisporus var. burnettii TaxID=192524 RepID=A0A8H7EXJ0_AGABI|nr:hypothetical protein Agabi119p4_9657 [Agaricus bisporus var. burnettii]